MVRARLFVAMKLMYAAWACCIVCGLAAQVAAAAENRDFAKVAKVLDDRCVTCHNGETREAGVDLTPLLREENVAKSQYVRLWSKVESMVRRGAMPPADEEALHPTKRQMIGQWFRDQFVLRDGQPHIGPTPLRRLTRYELENTLQELLRVQLKVPYRDTISGRIDVSRIASLIPSDLPGESGFDNDARRMEQLKPPLKEISVAVHFALGEFWQNRKALQAVLGHEAITPETDDATIKRVIHRFLSRAYRGRYTGQPADASVFFELYTKHRRSTKNSSASLRYVFEMILVSPEFLYRFEHSKGLGTPYTVSGTELATRLSYFLWSSMPDEELMRLGDNGSLLQDSVLKSQVARMLNSPRRLSLAENFAGQWLGFADLLTNSEYFVDERWNRETYDEVLFFFDALIKTDDSILQLVDSDWIYKRASSLQRRRHGYVRLDANATVNVYADVLAGRTMGKSGASKKGSGRKTNRRSRYDPPVLVKIKNDQEGGVITSPAIMRLTASKSRTSPIRRGVWVLSTVIGRQLEPPPDVPSLDEAFAALNTKQNPSVAEVIKQHVAKPICISCHKTIDPLGLGLENFGSDGRWRKWYPDKAPIESVGVMPNGKKFDSPRQMKQLLVELYKDEIGANFVKKLFAYAIGRRIEPYDQVVLDRIIAKAKQGGYKVNTVIEQIVLSQTFRSRQDR